MTKDLSISLSTHEHTRTHARTHAHTHTHTHKHARTRACAAFLTLSISSLGPAIVFLSNSRSFNRSKLGLPAHSLSPGWLHPTCSSSCSGRQSTSFSATRPTGTAKLPTPTVRITGGHNMLYINNFWPKNDLHGVSTANQQASATFYQFQHNY